MHFSVTGAMSQAHIALETKGVPPAELLAPDIYDSWVRSVGYGLDMRRPPSIEMVSPAVFKSEQERHSLVRGLALAEMETLHHQISGSNFLIAFATPDGLLLDVVADKSFAESPHAKRIRPGNLWSENVCGTNGVGTVAHMKRPVVVHGNEHFFPSFTPLTCAASPVFGPDGTIAGILDASSDCLSRQSHTRALVAMAATQIENGLLRERHRRDILIAFHNRGEFLHTLSAGLLAVDQDGKILALNKAASVHLHGLPSRPGDSFRDIFRTPFGALIDAASQHERVRLQDHVGSSYIATIEHPSITPMMMQAAVKPRAPDKKLPDSKVVAPKTTERTFVWDDPSVATIVRRAETAARRKMPILIRGETGTGKEQLARYVHTVSGRAGTFVAVNCAALPDTLIEAELFGYSEGAFTGARKGGSGGLFTQADGGTLFLDEIGDMPYALQSVLLRFLDDWTVRPVGGTARLVDVLLVSATNANLDHAIAERRFRSDLLFRLNTLEVTLPRLGERADFEAIAEHLMTKIDPERSLTPCAIEYLSRCEWPGNIRELRNALSRLTLQGDKPAISGAEAEVVLKRQPSARQSSTLHEQHVSQVLKTYFETGNNVSETARRLGVSRNTVYRALGEKSSRF